MTHSFRFFFFRFFLLEEAARFAAAMTQANKQKRLSATPQPTQQSRLSGVSSGLKSPRSSQRDSAYQGLSPQSEEDKVAVAESALSRAFRGLAELFDPDVEKPAPHAAKEAALQKYRELIDTQTKLLDGMGKVLIDEHQDVYRDFRAQLDGKGPSEIEK
jgi:hypothetical protein